MAVSGIPLSIGRQVLSPLRRVSPAYEREVEAVFALIAYEMPSESPLQHLVGDRAREAVADIVNAAILLDAQRSARAAAIATETGAIAPMTAVLLCSIWCVCF